VARGAIRKETLIRAAFDRDVDNAQFALANRVRHYLDLLEVAEPLFNRTARQTDGSSTAFGSGLLRSEYPAIAALGVLEETAPIHGELSGEPVSDRGAKRYTLRNLPEAPPSCGVSADLPPQARVAELMARAAAENSTVASSKLLMDCGSGLQDYVLLMRQSVRPPESASWHAALVLPAQLLNSPWRNGEQDLDYTVAENAGSDPDTLLYWAGRTISDETAWFRRDIPLEVGGRMWTLRFQSRDSFETAFDRDGANGAPWYGLMLGCVAFGLVWSFMQGRKRPIAPVVDWNASETEARAQAVLRHTTDGILGVDERGLVRSLNPAARELFGYLDGEALQEDVRALLNVPLTEVAGQTGAVLPALRRGDWAAGSELVARHRDGSEFPVEVRAGESHSNSGRGYTIIVRDIRARKQEQEQLERLASFPDNHPQPIVETDLSGKITYINPEAARRFPELRELKAGHPMFREFGSAVDSFKKGRERPVLQQFEVDPASYEQHLCYVPKGDFIRIYIFDITDRQQALEDPLTGLPNRTLFLDRLGQASKSAKADGAYRFAVLFLDLDNFKGGNDNYGHMVADQLLKIVARRLDGCLRPRDIVARLGGDEFTILLDNVREVESAQIVAARIQGRLGEPFELACHRFHTSVSIGIAMSTTQHQSPSDLLSYADAAMYRATTLGRARTIVFEPASHKTALTRVTSAGVLSKEIGKS
jgi:diguanylate cyclase (GGDEF)-like protein/PAS domain S-box-containing protein